VLREMIAAESLQLERRGQPPTAGSSADYFRVVEGKTAALFRWALHAGARVAGVDAAGAGALAAYGQALGVAFQLADDLLDLTGDPARAGKSIHADLDEGNVTYPLLLALEREPNLRAALAARRVEPLLAALARTGALDDSRLLLRRLAAEATAHLDALPPSRARDALATLAVAAVERDA
jgi:octaprenyl-diphosphate synthase